MASPDTLSTRFLNRDNLDVGSLLNFYRYGSLLITSLFYFWGPPAAPWYLKLGVSLCLLLETLVFTRVYQTNSGCFVRKALIAIETTGLAFILIITGGVDSPFLWYAINPILLATTLLPLYYCWSMAALFLTLAFSLHRFRLYSLEPSVPLWPERANFILVFILITLAAQLFNHLISKLSRQTEFMTKQIDHIKSLYEAIEALLLTEEKDRIAGEIHDKVTQNIFGLVYGLDVLIKQDNISEAVRQRVRLMQKTAQQCQRELRNSIYNMSSIKSNRRPFTDEIKSYLYNLGQLNDINVEFTCKGNFSTINPAARSAFYRIAREATANSIRHGFCKNIMVALISEEEKMKLIITDDGRGFECKAVEIGGQRGLGLVNMREQAQKIGGELRIHSSPGKGTTVCCEVNRQPDLQDEYLREDLVTCEL